MDNIGSTDLKSLISQRGKWCVSLFMPTHRVGRDQQQDPIRLKNLLAEAETRLLASDMRRPEVQRLLKPAEGLLVNPGFWQGRSDGVAIFLSIDISMAYRLPADFEELLIIAKSFYIKPLLPLLGKAGEFYILALSLKKVRLFQATLDTITEIALDFPTSMNEALGANEPEKYLTYHSGSIRAGEGGASAAIFHGHNNGDEEKTNIRRFFQSVNQGLNSIMIDRTVPMILAGVDYLLPIFREAGDHPNILEGSLIGNPERASVNELHEEAREIVGPHFEQNRKKALERFQQLHGQGSDLAVTDLSTAVKAARFGQVETLFVPLGTQIWGWYDPENNKVIQSSEPGPEFQDLLDLAAAETLLNSGQVFAVPREQVPGDETLGAILRYALPST